MQETREAWVTSATNPTEVFQSVRLAKSLRIVNTRKIIVLFVDGSEIDLQTRKLLEIVFDSVVNINDFQVRQLNKPLTAMLRMLNLPVCSKCVYVHPAYMAVRNCDEFFNESFYKNAKGDNVSSANFSIVALCPSFNLSETLKNLLKENTIPNCVTFEEYFQIFAMNSKELHAIKTKHVQVVRQHEVNMRFPTEIKIVEFYFNDQFSSNPSIDKTSLCEMYFNQWEDFFTCKTVPLFPASESISSPYDPSFGNEDIIAHTKVNDNHIAIIGLDCKFPGANNPKEFWDLLLSGADVVQPYPENRWKPKEEKLPNLNGNFLKCPINEFDGDFFGISAREAEYIDPQQRMLLETSWTALENAGIDPTTLKGTTTGVFMGIWKQNYENLIMKETNFSEDFVRSYLGNSTAGSSARISYQLGLTGPNVGTDSGCSSSMVSAHLACESLRRGESSLALAGGVNLICRPGQPSPIIAEDGRCKTFDANANGYGRAEGCGILVLKRLSKALEDGDNIMAIICGSGIAQEGTSSSFGTPSKNCQVLAIQNALITAGVDPLDVSYVEAHGTGTQKGDPVEVLAIQHCFAGERKNPLLIGSVKTNIGHTEAAAGVAGIIKVILSMKNHLLPAHRNFTKLNPLIDLKSIPAKIPLSPTEWKSFEGKPRIAGVNSFGISGTNVHVLLQEPLNFKSTNSIPRLKNQERTQHLLTISAKTEVSLFKKLTQYKNHFLQNPEIALCDYAFTANCGRAHFEHRIAITGATTEEMLRKIDSCSFEKSRVASAKQKILFLFPGQGSQYPQMGKQLYATHPVFMQSMDYCKTALKKLLSTSLLKGIWRGTIEEMWQHDAISIFCIQFSLFKLWKSFGVTPDGVLGHSLGEFAAVAAGILPVEDVLKMIVYRTALISNLPSGSMLAVKSGFEEIQKMIQFVLTNNEKCWIDVACINSKDQVVLAGRKEILEIFAKHCKVNGVKSHFLATTHAYHSHDMEAIIPEYFNMASKLNFSLPTCEYISGMSGTLLNVPDMNAQYWMDNCRYKVNFVEASETVRKLNYNVLIEIGAHPILLPLCIENTQALDALYLPSMRKNENNWETLLKTLAKFYVNGGNIDWNGFDAPYPRNKVELPTYPFERQKYWFEFKSKKSYSSFGTQLVHPLVGRNIPLATSNIHVYQNNLELTVLPYLTDHRISNRIILPCSAMLEMILASGEICLQESNQIMSEPLTSLVIEDLKIEAPFELKEEQYSSSQILVSSYQGNNLNGFQISVSKQSLDESGSIQWKRHAIGNFFPDTISSTSEEIKSMHLESIKNGCQLTQTGESFYSNLHILGLTFGDNFQSIKHIWKNSEEILALVELKQDESVKSSEYLCHPILSDAMIQLALFGGTEINRFCLPVMIKKFTWFARNVASKSFYVYTTLENKIIYLYDEAGILMAAMEGVSSVSTKIETFLEALSPDLVKVPKIYQEVWRCQSTLSIISSPHNAPGDTENHWIIIAKNKPILSSCVKHFHRNGKIPIAIFNDSTATLAKDLKIALDEIISKGKSLEGLIYFGNHLNTAVKTENINTHDIIEVGQLLLKANLKSLPKFVLITQGVVYNDDQEMRFPSESAHWGFAKTLKNENPSLLLLLIDSDPEEISSYKIVSQIADEIWNNDETDYQIAFRNSTRYVKRLTELNLSHSKMFLPNCHRYSIVLPKSHSVIDLKYVASSRHALYPNQVDVAIKATSLNFRDLMVILQPEGYYTKADVIGTDFSGVVMEVGNKVSKFKVGDSVFGLTFVGAMGSHVVLQENLLRHKPKNLSHCEAASLPCVFLTAIYCLENIAQLKPLETILIHAASGGIGLCCIQIAKSIGAKIIATAGSRRKRAYLHSLGVQHVFNSRNTDYGQQIKELSNGKGVDVVLNSLTGLNFKETTLSVCSPNARFVEIGKSGIWSADEVFTLRPDVIYSTFDLEQVDEHVIMEMTDKMITRFQNQMYKPLPFVRLPGSQVREALTHLRKANHIGKVVISTSTTENVCDQIIHKELLFNDESSYLITGGMGGIGLEVCKFMAENGARFLVLVNRSVPNKMQEEVLDTIKQQKVKVLLLQGDIGVYSECERILKELELEETFPPLRGIMHAAGVVSDGIISNQTIEKFDSVFHPKVQGAWNLHSVSLNYNLEHFVLFSSILANFNFPGQSNYSAANSFLDGLANYRNSLGLVATSINWGIWSEVGIAIKSGMGNEGSYGIKPFPPSEGIAALKLILCSHECNVVPVNLNVREYTTFFPHTKKYFEEVTDKYLEVSSFATEKQSLDSETFWKEFKTLPKDRTLHFVQTQIEGCVRQILKIKHGVNIEEDKHFVDMGMDSLMSVEMRNKLQTLVGKTLTLNSSIVSDYNTTKSLTDLLVNQMHQCNL